MPQHRHRPPVQAEQDAARLKISHAINTPSPAWLDLIDTSCSVNGEAAPEPLSPDQQAKDGN